MNIYIELAENITLPDEYKDIMQKAVEDVLITEGFSQNTEISVSLVDNEEIKELNKQYRNIDKSTDCLSFPQYTVEELIAWDKHTYLLLGDVVISVDKARAQAEEYGHSLFRELAFLVAHSTLHLLGYDHETGPEDELVMFQKQEEVLKKLQLFG